MGASQSTSHTHPPSRALHVLRVAPNSPSSHTNIEPFFDFLVGFEGDSLAAGGVNVRQLEKIVEDHEGKTLNLLVWNSKHQGTRVVPVVPSQSWSVPYLEHANGNEPSTGARPSLLGLSMRMCEPEVAMDNVWHVLDVLEGSPAESAGLVPYGDWIVGWSGGVLSAENDFYELVEEHIDKPLRVYVYSYDFDTLREVVLVPNRQWGGEGLLGCVFGFGLLHRIPLGQEKSAGVTPLDSEETLDEYEAQELFVPTDFEERIHEYGMTEYTSRKHTDHHGHTPHSPDNHMGHLDVTRPRSQENSHETVLPDHSLMLRQTPAARRTPRKSLPAYSMPTPVRSPSFSTIMNGPGTARLLSPRASTPVAGFRSPLSHFPGNNQVERGESEDEEADADNDGETSVTGTELGSDTHSLTSVE